jgi:hypothetical protein
MLIGKILRPFLPHSHRFDITSQTTLVDGPVMVITQMGNIID